MDLPPELAKFGPGIGGALLAAMTKIKEGLRIVLVQFVMGSIPIIVLQGVIEWLAHKVDVPDTLVGFGVGLVSVAVATKLLETVQALEFARPFNAFIERWTGAKAPPQDEVPKP